MSKCAAFLVNPRDAANGGLDPEPGLQALRKPPRSPGQATNFLINTPDGQPLKRLENEDRTWTGVLPLTGDYLICVATAGGTVGYNLSVTIPPAGSPAVPPATRIRFPAGGTAATGSGTVGNNGRQCYVLAARAGQLMTVQVSSPANVANFSLVSPDGSLLKRVENGAPYLSLRLPLTGDYTICVVVPAGFTPSLTRPRRFVIIGTDHHFSALGGKCEILVPSGRR